MTQRNKLRRTLIQKRIKDKANNDMAILIVDCI